MVDAEFAPTTHGILVARLPSKLWHIMIYLSLIVTAYRTSSIKQASKQIALNVSHFSSILPQAINYILHMRIIKLQEFAFHKILWIHISCDGDFRILGHYKYKKHTNSNFYFSSHSATPFLSVYKYMLFAYTFVWYNLYMLFIYAK